MVDVVREYVWNYLGKYLMEKIPAYFCVAALVLGVFGCSLFYEKPDMKLLAQSAEGVERISERTLENKKAMNAVVKKFKFLIAKEEITKADLEGLWEELEDYGKLRDASVKRLLKYLELEIKEDEALFEMAHGELPADFAKLISEALETIKDVREKQFPESE